VSSVSTRVPPWVGLFNEPAFLALRGFDAVVYRAGDGAVLTGVRTGDSLLCGASAPYAGIDLARERETALGVEELVDDLLGQLRRDGVRELRVRLAPASHAPATAPLVEFALLNRGLRIVDADLAFHLDLRATTTLEAYVAALRSPARRALKHADLEPYTVAHAETAAGWDAAWTLLEANRADRGRTLSLDRDYVENLREAFPSQVRMLELRHDGVLVAAAFTQRVRPGVEFVVAWGDAGHGLARSPMNRLALEVVRRALAEGIRTIDLGTSTAGEPLGRVVNAGLCRFKSSIGAVAEPRHVLEGAL
jgi:hypothetical protein